MIKIKPRLSFSTKIIQGVGLTVLIVLTTANSASAQVSPLLDTLSPTERIWLIENPVIKLGIDRAFPPFGSITETNEYVGFTADYMKLISERLGIKFDVSKDAPWNETINLAKSEKIDMIAGLVKTEERQDYLRFSPVYIQTPTIIINDGLKNGYFGSIKNLNGKTVAVEKGSFVSNMMTKEFPEIKQIQVKNTELALSIVAANRADAYIGNAVTASFIIKKMGFHTLFYSGTTPYSSDHSIGIVKSNPLLTSVVHKALASIDQKTRDEIAEKWFGMQVFPHIRRSTAIGFAAIALLTLIFSAFWIVTLYNARRALRLSERKNRHQANIDSLTGLINRRYMYEVLSAETSKPRALDDGFALLFLDLDEFKNINDTLGHSIGDELLKGVAERLRGCVRINDTVGRLGGDEFIIILKAAHQQEAIERIAKKVCDSLSTEFVIEDHHINVSTSIGITQFPKDATTADDLLINADQAMYAGKNKGGNGYCFFNDAMRQAIIERNETLRDLKLAVVGNQFELHYQPILNLKTGEITKAEALIRWRHPQRGLISPDLFIPLAEDSGQITEIGEWVFRTAAKQVAVWQKKYAPTFQISINTSPVQYRENGIDIERWCAYLERLGLTGQAIIVEITEGLLMESSSAVKEKLWSLRDAGIEVAIDDFGTGYSSLSYLKKFDIDYLKIDQSFVSNLTADSEDSALCEAITVMAHKLGCGVVAEGVENEEQSELLNKADCDFGQGYLFAKPLPADQFEQLLITSSEKPKLLGPALKATPERKRATPVGAAL